MIASRSLCLLRINRVINFTNTYAKPVQRICSVHTLSSGQRMGGAKDKVGALDRNRKRKTVNPVWRPISTQANSVEGSLVKDVTVESEYGNQYQEVQCSTSSNLSKAPNAIDVTETIKEIASSTLSSGSLQGNTEVGPSEGVPILSADMHTLLVEVGASLIRFIKGKGGSTQREIEADMGVKIIFPSSKKDNFAVKSPNLDYSHFVSLPLAIHPELVDKLLSFQNIVLGNSNDCLDGNHDTDSDEVTSDNENEGQQLDKRPDVAVELKVQSDHEHVKVDLTSIPFVSYLPKASKSSVTGRITGKPTDLGIDKSIFIQPRTFHLTVLMLKLWNKDRVDAAAEVLKSVSSKAKDALDNRPVFVRLKGLDCMRGSLAKARVLYAPVEEIGNEDRLMRACQVIIDAFVEAGLVLEKVSKPKLKLHATVMNARHRKGKNRNKKFDSFDARGIFKQFGTEEWGEYLIREAHLSQRFVFDESGYYHCCASIPFPENMQVD
ncbi:uncharacterized protein LOC120010806 isoform X2 [Tripterygium wilfordii]|uniref:uncharacterized protein LOC120010806 isoform X2 n=1 Tax=Tripterygium wilfordii TaxID=458696 RepID=UPI0018F7FD13|nr:uncharacterized protein LOC120010806 isoform X2 [Tripterygium wilfordii]